jgi:hypothetical protein
MSDLSLMGPIEHAVRSSLRQRGLPEYDFWPDDPIRKARAEDQINEIKNQIKIEMAKMAVPEFILVPRETQLPRRHGGNAKDRRKNDRLAKGHRAAFVVRCSVRKHMDDTNSRAIIMCVGESEAAQ